MHLVSRTAVYWKVSITLSEPLIEMISSPAATVYEG